jgi:Protein of unknown function (DUF2946)
VLHCRAIRKHLAALAWLALFALTLLPSLTRVVSAAAPGGWAEVCSAQGMRWVTPDGALSERGPGGQSATHGEHCPLCGSAAVALPPAAAAALLNERQAHFIVPRFLQAPPPRLAWSAAQARAPPQVA